MCPGFIISCLQQHLLHHQTTHAAQSSLQSLPYAFNITGGCLPNFLLMRSFVNSTRPSWGMEECIPSTKNPKDVLHDQSNAHDTCRKRIIQVWNVDQTQSPQQIRPPLEFRAYLWVTKTRGRSPTPAASNLSSSMELTSCNLTEFRPYLF